ncbi:hypothetical protein F511_35706 [Dorcoceras hygrometricum]|uniref:Uncharacterized protein n=1 Tax=Dorcoceras hygrometricum TaxID=472368 RepID=A0A2Z7CG14_9LAMI|nr:hypothetical protein F511_35706 [Dorcoceras hygrometricum]
MLFVTQLFFYAELLDQLGSPLLNQLWRPLTVPALDYVANLPFLIQLRHPLNVLAWMSSIFLYQLSSFLTALIFFTQLICYSALFQLAAEQAL